MYKIVKLDGVSDERCKDFDTDQQRFNEIYRVYFLEKENRKETSKLIIKEIIETILKAIR